MNRKFVSNLIFLVSINLIIKPFYLLGIDAGVQNAVGAKEYGLYFAIFNLSFLLNIISDLGITNFNNRNISQNRQLLTKHFSKLISLRMLLIVVYIGISMFIGWSAGYNDRMIWLLLLILLNQSLASFILYLRSNIAGLHLFKSDSILSVLDRFILIVICGFVLWGPTEYKFKIEWFIWFQTISYGITALVAFFIVKNNVSKLSVEFNKLFSLSILRQSLPYALLTLLMGVYFRMDAVMLERMIDDSGESSGIYAQGFRFLDALNNFSLLFAVLLFPIFARMLKKKMDLNPIILTGSKILFSGVLIISLTAFFFSPELMDWRYDDNLDRASSTFSILILTSFFYATVLIFGTLLTADGKLKELNYIALIGVFLNLFLNFILIPKQQEYGSALATFITQGVVGVAHILVAAAYFNLKTNWGIILRLAILLCLLTGAGFIVKNISDQWLLNAIIMSVFGLIVATILKLFDLTVLIELLKSRSQDNED